VLTRCSAVMLKAGKEGQYEREGYGQRPYDNWETIMFDCEGLVSVGGRLLTYTDVVDRCLVMHVVCRACSTACSFALCQRCHVGARFCMLDNKEPHTVVALPSSRSAFCSFENKCFYM
jgi:hypothetical protein